jgi:hypothetical protein
MVSLAVFAARIAVSEVFDRRRRRRKLPPPPRPPPNDIAADQ